MNPKDPQADTPEQILACYIIINGALGMSAGKIASQSFQAAHHLIAAYHRGEGSAEQRQRLEQWMSEGTRTITRIAETENIFARASRELEGATMIDEGLTEIEPGPTVHATWPLFRGEHRLLNHKRIPLLSGPPILNRKGGLRVSANACSPATVSL